MTFGLSTVFVFAAAALIYNFLLPSAWRGWALLVGSIVCVYWLQSALLIRFMDFILPTATLVLVVVVWVFTRKPDDEEQASFWKQDRFTIGLIAVSIIGMAFMRYVDADYRLTASRPPEPLWVAVVLLATTIIAVGIRYISRRFSSFTVLSAIILGIVGLFILTKTEPLAIGLSGYLRSIHGQDTRLAGIHDLSWLGFSYVAFRLIHTIRDRQTGRLPALSLKEYVTYVIFFPAFVAGPIDRAERFIKDYRTVRVLSGRNAARWIEGSTRIAIGIFKKFIIADSLAHGVALNTATASQAENAPFLWILLYGYGLRLFFDFSGYSDIAIGLGILFGIKLPENFDRPYIRNNITLFWQSWHITLSSWARFYVFTPLSRTLLSREPKPSPILIVLASQLATMIVIGLWHGVTWNFLIWGVWHGVGLFIHKRWSDRTRKWHLSLKHKPAQRRAWTVTGWFITIQFVMLGWVWFALPDTAQAVEVLRTLFFLK